MNPTLRNLFLAATLGAAPFAVACGGDTSADEGEHHSGGENAAAYAGPITGTDVAAGQALYEEHCNNCHPGGEAGYGPAVANIGWDAGHMRMQIREGEGRMPAFGEDQLDAAGLENMILYIQSIGGVTE